MSKLVNYKKRSVTLPPGCKNLIELLQPHRRVKAHSIPSDKPPTLTRDDSGTVKLSEIEKYVAMPFESHAIGFILVLSLPDERLTINFAQVQGEPMSALAVIAEDAQRERLIREFFVERNLELPRDDWTPMQVVPGVPVQLIYQISPLPSDATTAATLAAELFRCVCGLSDEDPLTFHYYEIANAA